jgi:hypothetical protein
VIASQAVMGAANPKEGITMTTDRDDRVPDSPVTLAALSAASRLLWMTWKAPA